MFSHTYLTRNQSKGLGPGLQGEGGTQEKDFFYSHYIKRTTTFVWPIESCGEETFSIS